MLNDYLKKILAARVYDVAIESPLHIAPFLSERLGNRIWVKREDQQTVYSFKLRGAYNKVVQLTEEEKAKGVVAASAGNHAQGLALAAQKLGIKATIVMPRTTPNTVARPKPLSARDSVATPIIALTSVMPAIVGANLITPLAPTTPV